MRPEIKGAARGLAVAALIIGLYAVGAMHGYDIGTRTSDTPTPTVRGGLLYDNVPFKKLEQW